MNSHLISLTAEELRRAAKIKERIDTLQKKLSAILSEGGSSPVFESPRPRRRMSRAAIARIRAGQKARWARIRAGTASLKPKRKMSPAVKSKLAAIARQRWKNAKASGRSTL